MARHKDNDNVLGFGIREPERNYERRPSVYAVILDDGLQVASMAVRGEVFLPGGGIEEGESPREALKRECVEEAGWVVRIKGEIGRANELFCADSEGRYYEQLGTFYRAQIVGAAAARLNAKHEPLWLTVERFEQQAARRSHLWAIQQVLARHAKG